jgi:hypothetical protein
LSPGDACDSSDGLGRIRGASVVAPLICVPVVGALSFVVLIETIFGRG